MKLKNIVFIAFCILGISCKNNSNSKKTNQQFAKLSTLYIDTSSNKLPLIIERNKIITAVLASSIPIILLPNVDPSQSLCQSIAINNKEFTMHCTDKNNNQPYRNEIFNIYKARPQEVTTMPNSGMVYKIEMYNYASNLTTTAYVDLQSKQVMKVTHTPQTQPEIPKHLKDLALQIAVNNAAVCQALGYKPTESEALMANTKTALNNTRCERSLHLCVAPTFIKADKALWVIVDLTDLKLVGIRWTKVGEVGGVQRISERNLKADKIMECYCKQINSVNKYNWKFNYVITTSDGLRISEVYYNNSLKINNAKVVDWHVSYSNTDGFGYSDAVGCPEFSQAAVVAVTEPKFLDIIENNSIIGFALEQDFKSEQWPKPCNYNYIQRFEFYKDGRFRTACASLGRGCGNNGTYRPVTRIAFAGETLTINEWQKNNWMPWETEQYNLQTPQTMYTNEGYQFKISDNQNSGYYLMPSTGQFNDGGRGDNAFVYVTKQHFDKNEGETDLVTIGPCCNTDYKQGPEKFIDAQPENILNTSFVVWYVSQMKNDDTPGKQYCWAENKLVNGIYQTQVFPCMSGPMFIPIKK
jgi:hypothetical protein